MDGSRSSVALTPITWSKEFLHSDVALPLPLDGLEPAENGHGRWAHPSREQLRRLMRYLQQHPREGKAIGEALVESGALDGTILLGFDVLCYRQIRVDGWWFWVLCWIFYDFTLGSGWKGNDDAEKMNGGMVGSLDLLGDDGRNGKREIHLAKRSQVSEKMTFLAVLGSLCGQNFLCFENFLVLRPAQLRCHKAKCRQRVNEWWKDSAQRRLCLSIFYLCCSDGIEDQGDKGHGSVRVKEPMPSLGIHSWNQDGQFHSHDTWNLMCPNV